jgi:hypothetical protein
MFRILRILLFAGLLPLLFSCGTNIKAWEIEKATELCSQHKGIDRIYSFWSTWVCCMDGSLYKIDYPN